MSHRYYFRLFIVSCVTLICVPAPSSAEPALIARHFQRPKTNQRHTQKKIANLFAQQRKLGTLAQKIDLYRRQAEARQRLRTEAETHQKTKDSSELADEAPQPSEIAHQEKEKTEKTLSLTQRIRQLLNNTYNFFSFSNLKNKFYSLIGSALQQTWGTIWNTVGTMLEYIIGRDKFYEMDKDGNILKYKNGEPVPRMARDEQGHIIRDEQGLPTPNFWSSVRSGKDHLLGLIAAAGADASIRATVNTLDHLVFRPLVIKLLNIPAWKLSYNHYLHYLYKQAHPQQDLLDPLILAVKIAQKIINGSLAVRTSFPIDVSFLRQKANNIQQLVGTVSTDTLIRQTKLVKRIQAYMWEQYKPVWDEYNQNKTDTETPDSLGPSFGTYARAAKSQMLDDVKHGPLAMGNPLIAATYMATVHVPQLLWRKFSNPREEEEEVADDNNEQIKTMNKILKKIKSSAEPNGVIKLSTTSESYYLHPPTQQKLLFAQEQIIEAFKPAFIDELNSATDRVPYTTYLKRLILPKMLGKLIPWNALPQEFKDTLGIRNTRELTQNLPKIEKLFDKTYHVAIAVTDLIAIAQELKGMKKLSGNYVKLFDAIDIALLRIMQTMRALGIPGPRTSIAPEFLLDRLWHRIGPRPNPLNLDAFTQEQQRQLSEALSKVNDGPNVTITVTDAKSSGLANLTVKEALDTLEDRALTAKQKKEAANTAFPVILKTLDRTRAEKDLERARFFDELAERTDEQQYKTDRHKAYEAARKAANRTLLGFIRLSSITTLISTLRELYTEWGIREVLEELDAHGQSPQQAGIKVLLRITKDRVVPHLVGIGVHWLFGKLFTVVLNKLGINENGLLMQHIQPFFQMAESFMARASGGQFGRGLGYHLGRILATKQGRDTAMGAYGIGKELMGFEDAPLDGDAMEVLLQNDTMPMGSEEEPSPEIMKQLEALTGGARNTDGSFDPQQLQQIMAIMGGGIPPGIPAAG